MKLPVVLFLTFYSTLASTIFPDPEAVNDPNVGERIVGGQNASPGQFKYQVSLRYNGGHFCGASIISATRVLTAAHCNKGLSGLTIITGTNEIRGIPYIYRATQFLNHPSFNPKTLAHDIAIIKINGKIVFNNLVQPVGLPIYNVGPNSVAITSGWGLTKYPGTLPRYLQFLRVNVVASNRCTVTQVCTLNKKGQGICSGDSGGPLVANGQLHGIASAAHLCALGYPDYFTRVYAYKAWIQKQM